MECHCISYRRVPKSSALLLDYLYQFDRVAPFYNGSPFDLESYRHLADQLRTVTWPRAELAEILTRQNRSFGCGEETLANIRRLADSGTLAVVTGQQVGLLSGPAFTLYKALTAVKLSQYLSEQGLQTVPVFWLATEDHDLEEVAHTAVFDRDFNLVSLSDPGERPAPKSQVGHVKLTAGISAILDQFDAVLAGAPSTTGDGSESRQRLLEDLRDAYRPGATWGHAFGSFMTRLFRRWGVVLIDPLDNAVHRLSARIYRQALGRASELRTALRERSERLVAAGYHAQVHLNEDGTLLFVNRHGNRLALHTRGSEFALEGGDGADQVSRAGLENLIASAPLDFSPNALLRPILQDNLLPTLAYIAGPSELAYLAQSGAIYPEFGRPMPVIFPRAGFTLVDRRTQKLMKKYRLNVDDAWHGPEHLSQRIAAAGFAEGWSERLDQNEQELTRLLERLRGDIEKLDPTLLDTLQHAEEKIKYQMERLRGKITRAALGRSELLSRHEQLLSRCLAPRKDLQEREVSGVYFLGQASYKVLENILAQIQTRRSDHQTLVY